MKKNETKINGTEANNTESEFSKISKNNQSVPDNTSNEYGSSKNPAKSCKDLAEKGLMKNQPDVFFIETSDHEILQVFCPQSETFDFSKINQNNINQTQIYTNLFSTIKNSNPKNTLVLINGTGSTGDSSSDLNHGTINQTTSFNSDMPQSQEAKARYIDEDYQSVHNITSKIENQTEINVNSTNNNNNTSQLDEDVFYAKKIKETQPVNDNLIGKNIIGSNSKRSKIYRVRTQNAKPKNLSSKEKMKIPLYKPLNNLIKGLSKPNNNKKDEKQTVKTGSDEPRKISKTKTKSRSNKHKSDSD